MNKYMQMAIEEARKGIQNGDGGPFGAVIVKNDKVIGIGHNRVILKMDPTRHGEMEAIQDACKNLNDFDLKGCEIYTTGYPCPMCMGAIKWANISKIYYGCNVKDTDKIGFRDEVFYNEKYSKDFINEVDREECLKLYEEYTLIENKTHY